MNTFEALIHPLTLDDFNSQYYEKKHAHIKTNNASRFSDLISFEKLDEIVGMYGLTAPDITVVNSRNDVSKDQYIWKGDLIDPVKVAGLFAKGATVIFNSLQDQIEPLRQLCSGMSEDLQLKNQTNIYLTPPDSQGFNAHWDTHDVFVLQVEGSKNWKIYKESFELPLEESKYKFEKDCIEASNVVDEFVLEQGDILYIPRGVMHSATSSTEKSLHVTLGITAYTWKNFIMDYVEQLADADVNWRESVSLLPKDRELVKHNFDSKLKEMMESVNIESITEKHVRNVKDFFRIRKPDLLSQSLDSSDLKETDIIVPHNHNNIKITESDDKHKIKLNTGMREIIFPIVAKKTINLIFNSNKQSIGEFNDDIDWESRKLVVDKLLKESLVFKTINA